MSKSTVIIRSESQIAHVQTDATRRPISKPLKLL
jgi:hypothetical protein